MGTILVYIIAGVFMWIVGWRTHDQPQLPKNELVKAPQWLCTISGNPYAGGIIRAGALMFQLSGVFIITYEILYAVLLRDYLKEVEPLAQVIVIGIGICLSYVLTEWLRKTRRYHEDKE